MKEIVIKEDFPLAYLLYEVLLKFYPKEYRKEYSAEMRTLFDDLYSEETQKRGAVSLWFWFKLVGDVVASTLDQHLELIKNLGFLKYLKTCLNISKSSLISLILLVPFILLFLLNFFTVLLTGNRHILSVFYTSPWWFTFVTISLLIMPILAVMVSFVSLTKSLRENKGILSVEFIADNFFSLIIAFLGLSFLIFIAGHDMIPCSINQTFQQGLLHFPQVINYCQTHY